MDFRVGFFFVYQSCCLRYERERERERISGWKNGEIEF